MHVHVHVSKIKAPFIWSRVPESALLPSYPFQGNFKLLSLQNQPTVYIRLRTRLRGQDNLGG